MAVGRMTQDARIETRAARTRLPPRDEPYWRLVTEGSHIGFRKGQRAAGSWVARYRGEEGGAYLKTTLGRADDVEDADGDEVFDFMQAMDLARDWFDAQREPATQRRRSPSAPTAGGYTVNRAIADYLADLASVGGKVQLIERPVQPEEVGKSLNELATGGRGLRIYRGGKARGFWEAEARSLEAGDVVVEIAPTDVTEHA